MPPITVDAQEVREGESISIYPITRQQWEALQEVAAGRDETRADLLRDAVEALLDDRDAGKPVIYRAAVRLQGADKAETKPRIFWLKSPMLERFRDRCVDDRVSQSELILEALRRYLDAEKIEIDPPI